MTDKELKQLAIDLAEGKIFTSLQIEKEDIAKVFLALLLGAFADKTEDEMKDIGILYEYMDKAAPRSINGLPCFFSFHYLGIDDSRKLLEFHEEYEKVKNSFLN